MKLWTFAATLSVGISLGGLGAGALSSQAPAFSEAFLFRTDLAGLPGKELIVSRLETAPGWAHGRHYHAGHELVYVLEGSGIAEVEGGPSVPLKPGLVFYAPPGRVHAGRNPSATASLKLLLVRIHDKQQPISVELE